MWVSTAVLYRWNRKTGELQSYETSSDRLDDFGNTGAWTMIKSADGKSGPQQPKDFTDMIHQPIKQNNINSILQII